MQRTRFPSAPCKGAVDSDDFFLHHAPQALDRAIAWFDQQFQGLINGSSRANGVRPMIETVPLANAAEAYGRMMRNEARFRMVLVTGQ